MVVILLLLLGVLLIGLCAHEHNALTRMLLIAMIVCMLLYISLT